MGFASISSHSKLLKYPVSQKSMRAGGARFRFYKSPNARENEKGSERFFPLSDLPF